MRLSTATALLGLSLLSGHALAATFTVGNGADIKDALPGDGKCSFIPNHPVPNDPGVCTLRAAIMEANADGIHDTIVLPQDGYFLLTIPGRDEDNAATGDLDIRQPVTIRPPVFFGIPGHATVDANDLDRVFHVISVPGVGVNLIGLTIKGGDPVTTLNGGGIQILHSRAALSFLDVSATRGDGLSIGNSPDNEEVTITYSTLSGGVGSSSGINNAGAVLTVESSAILNSIANGIKLQNPDSQLFLNNSTVSGNGWAGISVFGPNHDIEVIISHSTIAGNDGGFHVSGAGNVIKASSSVFASNGSNCLAVDGATFVMEDNLYDDDSCPAGGVNDNSLIEPVFLSLLGDHGGPTPTHRPMVNSPALDAIAAADCADAELDQRLMPRPVAFTGGETRCDLGAVELETDVIFFDQFDRL